MTPETVSPSPVPSPVSAPASLGGARDRELGVLGILWRDLPLLNYALYAWGIAHGELQNLEPARPDLVPSFVFPWFGCLGLASLRYIGSRDAPSSRRERAVVIGVGLAVPLLVGLSALSGARTPLSNAELRAVCEGCMLVNVLLVLIHAARHLPRGVAFLLGPVALYGLLLENGGIIGGYFSELHYRLYLGPLPAPLATMCAWVTVFYLVTWVTWQVRAQVAWIRQRAWASALVTTTAALLLDLQFDPLATTVGFWRWHPLLMHGRVSDLMGVPLLNFVAWAAAVFPFAHVLFARENAFALAPGAITQAPHLRYLLTRVPLILLYAAALFLACMIAAEGGVSGPTFQIMQDTLWRWGLWSPDAAWTPGA